MLIEVLILFFAVAISASAHVLSGYVLDTSDNPLEDISVRIEDETSYSFTETDADGYFEFIVPSGYYGIFVNDDSPILWEYTGAGIGYGSPMIDVASDIQIDFILVETYVSFDTNNSVYHNGDIIEINLTVENNEYSNDLINWEVWAELSSWNGTHYKFIGEDYYRADIGYETIESFPLYIEIPLNNTYDSLYLDSGIWAYGVEFYSSKGLLEGELWNWYGGTEIFVDRKIEFNINLSKGWNLISIPLNLTNNILPEPLSSIEGNYSCIFTYPNKKWRSYCDGDPPSSDKYLTPTAAFWINMINDDVLEVEGYEVHNIPGNLSTGWNLIGYPYLEQKKISELFNNVTVRMYNNSKWYSYDSNKPPQLNTFDKFTPGYGYWVSISKRD